MIRDRIFAAIVNLAKDGRHDMTNLEIAAEAETELSVVSPAITVLVKRNKLKRTGRTNSRRLFLLDQDVDAEEQQERTYERNCLRCEVPFVSDSPYLRLCIQHRQASLW